MARGNINQTSFTGGVLSPRVLGRVDMDRYFTGLRESSNGYAFPQGGFVRRPGMLATAACNMAAVSSPDPSVLIPFVVGRDTAFVIDFDAAYMTIFDSTGAQVAQIAAPYSPIAAGVDYAQADSTLWLFSPLYPPHRLQWVGGSTFVLGSASFTTHPFSESGYRPTIEATLSSAAVGAGRTLTAASGIFQQADVGRGVIYGSGLAVITGYTSTTQVTVEVTRAFGGTLLATGIGGWVIDSSPQTSLTPGGASPVGATVTLTLGTDGWRSTDVGSMARINGGLLRITGFTSATVVDAKIVRELSGTTAAQALAWSLEPPAWSAAMGYPRTGTFYQQRLVVGGTYAFPRTIWGSRIAEPLDFEIGTTDDLAFAFTMDGNESSAISYITASPDLLVLTESGEYSVRGGVEKGITPTNVRIRQESPHGCAEVRPVFAGGECLFVQRAGRKVRSMGYRYDMDRYSSPDITALAEHVTAAKVVSMCWQQEPDPLLWVALADGTFLVCTLDRDQQPSIVGWFPQATDGLVEMFAAIPTGNGDQVWAIVSRIVNGTRVRLIERFDYTTTADYDETTVFGLCVDGGYVFESAGGTNTFSVPRLSGRAVAIVADGKVMETATVSSGGSVTISRDANKVQIGLPFETRARLLPVEMGTNAGTAQGAAHRTGRLICRFLDTLGAKIVGPEGDVEQIPFDSFGDSLLDEPAIPFTGTKDVTVLGWAREGGDLTIVQDLPLPMHLLSVTRRHTANEG